MTAIDLFAGAGGFSLGARMAGVRVIWAANHWRVAVDAYGRAHPDVVPRCQDLHQCDWSTVPDHDVLLASPACQGHSKARGKNRPHHDNARSTAWAVISCAEVKRPSEIIVENVPEMMTWTLYPIWRSALERLGYSVCESVLDAADSGVPQHRIRLFIHASRRRAANPIRIQSVCAHTAAASILSDLPATTPLRSLCPRTIARARQGRIDFGPRFLLPYYSSARTGRSLAAPIGTITTRARYALVDGKNMRMLTVPEYRSAMGFPEDFALPPNGALAIHLLGNAVPPPLARDVIASALRI